VQPFYKYYGVAGQRFNLVQISYMMSVDMTVINGIRCNCNKETTSVALVDCNDSAHVAAMRLITTGNVVKTQQSIGLSVITTVEPSKCRLIRIQICQVHCNSHSTKFNGTDGR